MKRRIVKITGIFVVVFALVANLQYALISYGLKKHQASLGVLAQTNSDTGTGTDDPNDPWVYSMPGDVDGYDGDDDSGGTSTGTGTDVGGGSNRELRQIRCVKIGA